MSINLKKEQVQAIKSAGISVSKNKLDELLANQSLGELSKDDLELIVKAANATYRAGAPIMSDSKYDSVYIQELRVRDPQNPFLDTIEPEPIPQAKTVPLPVRMLSTDKAYSFEEISKWVDRLVKAAKETGVELTELELKVTPKLDGYAAYDDGKILYTRGDGSRGQDITRAFDKGLKVVNGESRGQGPGEIVIRKSYFDEKLSGFFENSRNIQASIIAEKKIDEKIQEAIDVEACVFYPFSALDSWTGHYSVLLETFDNIVVNIWSSVDYDVDGVVLETTNQIVKEYMGATRNHHRWQIAYKVNEEVAQVRVVDVIPQTSRTGKLTPVALLEPTKLSGANISRATVHHFGMVKSKGMGKGALVELVRSGLVIPKIERVIEPVDPLIPAQCPSCGAHVVWDADNLFCPNTTDCPAQAENTFIHFFKVLGNVDGFGPKVISKIYQAGIKSLYDIYNLKQIDFLKIGFGDKTSANLVAELRASRHLEIEDWRFLAAFGVPRLGKGNCERLLEHHELLQVFDLSVSDMVAIDGFAEISASTISEGLKSIRAEFLKVYGLGFNLKITATDDARDAPLKGEVVVFTGAMDHGGRSEMEAEAKSLGAKVAKSVSGNTTYLVTGRNVGQKKIDTAKSKGVKVLSEAEYLDRLKMKGGLN